MKNTVAMEGKPLPPMSEDEKAVYAVLSEQKRLGHGPLSSLGLSRWVRKKPELMQADEKIAAAAHRLWCGMMIAQDEDGNYSCP